MNIPGYSMDYLRTSDARILIDVIRNDAILVTANIKDFITLLFFVNETENRLYDVLNQQYVQLPRNGLDAVRADSQFDSLNVKIK